MCGILGRMRTSLVILCCLGTAALASACAVPPESNTSQAELDTATELTFHALAAHCAGAATGAVPTQLVYQSPMPTIMVEYIDIEAFDGGAYGVGQGGVISMTGPATNPTLSTAAMTERYHRIERLDGTIVAVANRDRGVEIIDMADPENQTRLANLSLPGAEGLLLDGTTLFVAVRNSGIYSYDISQPDLPRLLGQAAGLSAPWEITAAVDGIAYVADGSLGLVPVDISDPTAVEIHAPTSLEGAFLHAVAYDGYVYVSAGSAGIEVFSTADPIRPEWLYTLPTGGSVVMASASDGMLYAVDHEGLTTFDIRDPLHPVPMGSQPAGQIALAVDAHAGYAWVGDWMLVSVFQVAEGVEGADISVASNDVFFPAGESEVIFEIRNLGNADLRLLGATTDQASFTFEVSGDVVAPGQVVYGRVAGTLTSPGEVCLATNAAEDPVLRIAAGNQDETGKLGQPAPDFTLSDLDGNEYTLSEQLGHPVFLAYFASW